MLLSVITPTYNPRPDYLARVTAALQAQTLDKAQWEYIVVDNNSSPPLSGRVDLSWHPNARLVVESKQGLTPARLRGFAEAKGEVIVLVDDDCLLAPDFLATALAVLQQYPHIGALGGYIEGEFEVPIPEWLKEFAFILCAQQFQPEPPTRMQYALARRCEGVIPVGAAMILRRSVVDAYVERLQHDPFGQSRDRTGQGLVGSGDTDIAITAMESDFAIGVTNRLQAKHLIPARRMELDYVRRLLYASNYGVATLLLHRGYRKPARPFKPTIWQQLRSRLARTFKQPGPIAICWKAYHKGYQDGISQQPMDPEYV